MLLMAAKLAVSVALLAFLFSRIDTRASVGQRAHGVAALAGRRARRLRRQRDRQHLALAAAARRAGRAACQARTLLGSLLVATFFNNFLPSNIGGDVIRIRDTAGRGAVEDAGDDGRAGRSRPRPDGLVLVSAVGATIAAETARQRRVADLAVVAVGGLPRRRRGHRAGRLCARRASAACCSR